jgi:hypothetical protein
LQLVGFQLGYPSSKPSSSLRKSAELTSRSYTTPYLCPSHAGRVSSYAEQVRKPRVPDLPKPPVYKGAEIDIVEDRL